MKKLGKMRLLHADGTVVSFRGARLEDDDSLINRFLYKHGALSSSVVISFDKQSNHQYWKCSCGGYNLPYSACDHLKYLEIIPNVSDGLIVLTEDEFGHFNHLLTPSSQDIEGLSGKQIGPKSNIKAEGFEEFNKAVKKVEKNMASLSDALSGVFPTSAPVKEISPFCVSCGKRLPKNSGWCSCGIVNAEYESKLQETNSSVGIMGQGMDSPAKPSPNDIFAEAIGVDQSGNPVFIVSDDMECVGFSNTGNVPGGMPIYKKKKQYCSVCGTSSELQGAFSPKLGGGLICGFCKVQKKVKKKIGGSKIPEPWELACDQFTQDPNSTFCIECGYRKSDHEMKKAMTPGFVGKGKTTVQFNDGSVMDMDSSKVKFTFRDASEGRFPEPIKSKDIPETKGKRVFADKDEEV